ncbi:hypothetical protein ACFWPK_28895 [Nocardia sp. NPDC058519]|uniref:hypothetical protein n=1 Tax=Nocardia sp. NPDC058519 TaxID=3346535 RepID=UPI003659456D
MTTTHHTTVELVKLARVLDRTPADLEFLATLPPAALREFRDQITDLTASREARRMQRVGAAAKLVPAPIAAKITEAAFGPVLAAALAGSVDPSRAVAIASALSPSFLADATLTLDPRRAVELIAQVPGPMAAAVASELITRGDYLTMGNLAGSVPDSVLRAALPHASDLDILQVGYYLEETSAADRLLTVVTDRVPGVIRATHEAGEWPKAITLLALLGPTERSRLANVVAAQDDEVIDGLLTAVEELDAWDTLLPVAAGMDPEPLQRLAQRPTMQNPTLLTKIADLALTQNLWLSLLPLATHLSPTQLHTVAARVAAEPDDSLTTLIEQAHTESHWPTLLPVALALSTPDRKRLASLPVMHRPAYLTAVIEATASHNLWPEALPLLNDLPTTTHDTLATTINTLTDNEFRAAVQAAPAADCTTTLIQILLRQDFSARSRSLTLLNEADNLEALVGTITTRVPAIWQGLSDIRTEIPERLRSLLATQATRCDQPELADNLTAD